VALFKLGWSLFMLCGRFGKLAGRMFCLAGNCLMLVCAWVEAAWQWGSTIHPCVKICGEMVASGGWTECQSSILWI